MSSSVPSSTPSLSERMDALRFLAQTHRGLHAERAKASNRLLLGVAIFYLLAIAGRFGSWSNSLVELALSTCRFQIVVSSLLLLLAFFTWYTLWCARDADAKNKKLAEEAENEIRRLVASNEYPSLQMHDRHENKAQQVLVLHACFIVLLAIITVCLLIFSTPK